MFIVLPRTIYYSESMVDAVKRISEELGIKRILVVTDRVVSGFQYFKDVLGILEKEFDIKIFSNVEPEPSIETAYRIAELARKHEAQLFLALGGGSVIDAAKAGLILYENPDIDIESVSPFIPLGLGRKAKLVAVPTTSGTGSDASYGIVLSKKEDEGKRKLALGSYELVPYATVLDINFTMSMPLELTRNTAIDALSHAVEAYVAIMASPFSDALAEKVVELIFKFLPRVLSDPKDEEARRNLHLAATMAGIAFTNGGLGLAHAIAHSIGPLLGLHHGLAVGLVLPHVVEFNSKDSAASVKYSRLSRVIELFAGRKEKASLRDHLIEFYNEIGHPYKISMLDKHPSQTEWEKLIPFIASRALEDPEVAFNPVPVSREDIEALLKAMY